MHYAPIASILCTHTALARRDGHIFVSGMRLKEDTSKVLEMKSLFNEFAEELKEHFFCGIFQAERSI